MDPPGRQRVGELKLGLAAGGDLRWAVVDVGGPLETARLIQDLSPLGAVALGRALAAAALLLRFTSKLPGSLRVELNGDGPLGRVRAEATKDGLVRGTVGNPRLAHAEGEPLALAPAIGAGTLRVVRDGPHGRWESQVRLVSGEIGKDLVHFLEQSEQIHSAAFLGVLLRPRGVASAGGLLIEALPGARERTVADLEKVLLGLEEPSRALDELGAVGFLDRILAGGERQTLESHPIRYGCSCDRPTLIARLRGLEEEEKEELLADREDCEAVCGFCGQRYVIHRDELREPGGSG